MPVRATAVEVEEVGEEVDQPQQDQGDYRTGGTDEDRHHRDAEQPETGREIPFVLQDGIVIHLRCQTSEGG
jgi:hypothetical protein